MYLQIELTVIFFLNNEKSKTKQKSANNPKNPVISYLL